MEPTEEKDFLPTRCSLLTRLKDWDDKVSWKRFFDTYWKLIYGAGIKSGLSDAEAQDMVQETVLSVAKKMNEFKYDPALGSFKGWLLTLTRWRIADQVRKRARHERFNRPASDDTARTSMIETVPDPESLKLDAIWDAEWEKNLMDAAIERVKRKEGARQYQIFDLYVIKNWKVKDVANTLGVSTDQVYQAKSRISASIREEYNSLRPNSFNLTQPMRFWLGKNFPRLKLDKYQILSQRLKYEVRREILEKLQPRCHGPNQPGSRDAAPGGWPETFPAGK